MLRNLSGDLADSQPDENEEEDFRHWVRRRHEPAAGIRDTTGDFWYRDEKFIAIHGDDGHVLILPWNGRD